MLNLGTTRPQMKKSITNYNFNQIKNIVCNIYIKFYK